MVNVRRSVMADYPSVMRLLRDASLPVEGVREHFGEFLVAEEGSSVVGAIGLEVYTDTGLLRSAVVRADLQRHGVGKMLTDALLAEARDQGIKRLILLTTTAEAYFAAKGFKKIRKDRVTGPVTISAEFTGACPSSAVCMEMVL